MRLFLLLLVCLHASESLRCHNMAFPDDESYLTHCSITLHLEDEVKAVWNSPEFDCETEGCVQNEQTIHCCCKKELCNTLEYALVTADEVLAPLGYYSLPATLLCVFLSQLIFMTCLYCNNTLRMHQDTLPKTRHIDLTAFVVKAALTPQEKEEAQQPADVDYEEELFALKGAALTAVVSYSCDQEISGRVLTARLAAVDENSSFEEIFAAVLSCGPTETNYEAGIAINILKEATAIFQKEYNVVMVNPPIACYADLHGQYSDLWRWFHLNGWPSKTRCIFMGDYVDRGRHSTEVFLLLALLRILYPSNIVMLRGNHEDGGVNRSYTFYSEVTTRFGRRGEEVFEAFVECFSAMPMSCLIGSRILCMHGGLTPLLPTVSDIDGVDRPTSKEITKNEDFIGLLWSDPGDVRSYKLNVGRDEGGRGIGYLFGRKQIRKFCRKNKLDMLIRGHQPPLHGYEHFCNRLVTLFSAPGYRTEAGVANLGASILIDEEGRMIVVRLSTDGTTKRKRWKLAKGEEYASRPAPPDETAKTPKPKGDSATTSDTSRTSSTGSSSRTITTTDRTVEPTL